MPNQCSFFTNFLAAFRAHAAIQQGKATSKPSKQSHSVPHHPHSAPHSHPRSFSTSSKVAATTSATTLSPLHSPQTHSTSSLPRSPVPQTMNARYMTSQSNGRRGSDSSTEGFRDVLGTEKWYIGGRTATGEEKYFKLGVIRRQKSRDRLSLDRLSL